MNRQLGTLATRAVVMIGGRPRKRKSVRERRASMLHQTRDGRLGQTTAIVTRSGITGKRTTNGDGRVGAPIGRRKGARREVGTLARIMGTYRLPQRQLSVCRRPLHQASVFHHLPRLGFLASGRTVARRRVHQPYQVSGPTAFQHSILNLRTHHHHKHQHFLRVCGHRRRHAYQAEAVRLLRQPSRVGRCPPRRHQASLACMAKQEVVRF